MKTRYVSKVGVVVADLAPYPVASSRRLSYPGGVTPLPVPASRASSHSLPLHPSLLTPS